MIIKRHILKPHIPELRTHIRHAPHPTSSGCGASPSLQGAGHGALFGPGVVVLANGIGIHSHGLFGLEPTCVQSTGLPRVCVHLPTYIFAWLPTPRAGMSPCRTQPPTRRHSPFIATADSNSPLATCKQCVVLMVRCAVFDRTLHSRMPLVRMPARFNANGIPLGWPLSYRFTL